MSIKYLGEVFDIHGGGMDLLFPHHECELIQSKAILGHDSVKYWVHNNMFTIDGQKMSKSLGNFITLDELFTGSHKLLERAYSPVAVRFFILQAHYRSTLDFSNEALQASEVGLQKIFAAMKTLPALVPKGPSPNQNFVEELNQKCYNALNEDLNSAILIAHIFDAVRLVNSIKDGTRNISADDLILLKDIFNFFVTDILGLNDEVNASSNNLLIEGLINMLQAQRRDARLKKDFQTSDRIRDELSNLGVWIKDNKEGFEWGFK
jgi:cysteinyl-tRNA synthetase